MGVRDRQATPQAELSRHVRPRWLPRSRFRRELAVLRIMPSSAGDRVQNLPQFDAAIFKVPNQRGFLFISGGRSGVPSYWHVNHSAGSAPIHLAFAAPSREAVDTFHAAALAHGGRDNGAPGFRDQGLRREANYVAFVLDPDNNNIEAS
jgi:catechol 2,3-dioxygenase-like lactoylglutathione lyase family enzyme